MRVSEKSPDRESFGMDEASLALGLLLLTGGLWVWLGPVALAAPGAVIVWMALPARRPFVDRLGPDVRRPR
jgi:hypothetical protein